MGTHKDRPCEEQDWKNCEQEEEPLCQEVPLDRSSQGCPCSSEDQGFRSYQEGNATLCQGQGALPEVSALSNHEGLRQRHQLQMWGCLHLWSASACLLGSTWRHIDEGYI